MKGCLQCQLSNDMPVSLTTTCPNERYSELSAELLKKHSVSKTRSRTNVSGTFRPQLFGLYAKRRISRCVLAQAVIACANVLRLPWSPPMCTLLGQQYTKLGTMFQNCVAIF
eukprot:61105-Amphidinium_carterae.2